MKTLKTKTFGLILLFICFFSAASWAQVLVVKPHGEPNEGGEIQLMGAGGSNSWRIDNYQGNFRLHHSGHEYLRMKADGTLGVYGVIRAKKVKVSTNIWSDYVFKKAYVLPSLEEVAQHIAANGHLKDIPSAATVVKNGIDLGDMDAKLLAKIEELTLYMIDMNKRIKSLELENQFLKNNTLKTKQP